MAKTSTSDPSAAPPPPGGADTLFRLLLREGTDPALAYTAIREMESMAGQNVFQAIEELRTEMRTEMAELRTELRTELTELRAAVQVLSARQDSFEKQLRLVWTFLVLILGTLLGALTTLLLR